MSKKTSENLQSFFIIAIVGLVAVTGLIMAFRSASISEDVVGKAIGNLYGICIVRDEFTYMPPYTSSSTGQGYSKFKLGLVNSFLAARKKCTASIYQSLTAAYCSANTKRFQRQVAAYSYKNGGYVLSAIGCASAGCQFYYCPTAQPPAASNKTNATNTTNTTVIRITNNSNQQRWPKVSDRAIVWWDDRNVISGDINTDIYAYDFNSKSELKLTNKLPQYCTNGPFEAEPGKAIPCGMSHPESSGQWEPDIGGTGGTKVVYEEFAHVCYHSLPSPGWYVCQDIYMYDFVTGASSAVSSRPTNQNSPRIDGNRVAWYEAGTFSGKNEVWWKDLGAGVEEFIGYGAEPAISGDYIAFRTLVSSIVVYNVLTKQKIIVPIKTNYGILDIDGTNVVYSDGDYGQDVYLYNIATGISQKLTKIGYSQERRPLISGQKVVYNDNSQSNLSIGVYKDKIAIYDLTTKTESIVGVGKSSNDYPWGLHNGKVVIQSNLYDLSDVFLYTIP